MKNKLLLTILGLCITLPCFADVVIPLWLIGFVPGFELFGNIGGTIFAIITGILLLLLVVIIEAFIIKLILKIEYFKDIFKIALKANIISTLVGCIFLCTTLCYIPGEILHKLNTNINLASYECEIITYFILCFVSFVIEYFAAKKDLKSYSLVKVKISFLLANIATYLIIPVVMIIKLFLWAHFIK